jgi:photosystem II stability/assembly factor-like uncharacterized protein
MQLLSQCIEQRFGGEFISSIYMKNTKEGIAYKNLNTTTSIESFYTSDGGQNWQPQQIRLLERPSVGIDLYPINDSIAFSILNGGSILKNLGQEITPLNHGSNFFNSFDLGHPNKFFGLTSNNKIGISENGGVSWTFYNVFNQELNRYYNVSFPDIEIGYVVGSFGSIRKSKDGGKTWRAANSSTSNNLLKVNFVSADTGWVAGEGGYLAKTVDGGDSFEQQIQGYTGIISDMVFMDKNTGYAVGTSGAFFRTIDGGKVWQRIKTGSFENLWSISCPAKDTCWMCGEAGTIIKFAGSPTITDIEEEYVSSKSLSKPSLYPNPAKDILNIYTQAPISKAVVYHSQGSKIMEHKNTNAIDVSGLESGLYYIELWDCACGRTIQKFVKN